MSTDQIADLLTRMRNASLAGHKSVSAPASGVKKAILAVLEKEGFIRGFSSTKEEGGKESLTVKLSYTSLGRPVFTQIERLSRPGKRIYVGRNEIPRLKGGLGTVVLSTPKGLLTDREARHEKVGGELMLAIF